MIKRLMSLDVFRGLAMVGIILVNSPGYNTAYTQLEHAKWHGCHIADCFFPFFLFIVGVAIALSLTIRVKQGKSFADIFLKIVRRTIILFLIGLFLNAIPHHMSLVEVRIMGVLQRIALCYFFSALIFLIANVWIQALITVVLLVGYWLLMSLVPVPGFGPPDLSEMGNLASYLDRIILAGHLYLPQSDPEGVLSTLPAIATTLIGCLTGQWLLTSYSNYQKLWGMLVAGVVSLLLAWMWSFWFPFNKALWTSSFVLWTGGAALIILGLCYWLDDILLWRKWSKPLEIFGSNAIVAYVLHLLLLKLQVSIHLVRPNGQMGDLRMLITDYLFGWASPNAASLMYAISYACLIFIFVWILYRKKIFIKI